MKNRTERLFESMGEKTPSHEWVTEALKRSNQPNVNKVFDLALRHMYGGSFEKMFKDLVNDREEMAWEHIYELGFTEREAKAFFDRVRKKIGDTKMVELFMKEVDHWSDFVQTRLDMEEFRSGGVWTVEAHKFAVDVTSEEDLLDVNGAVEGIVYDEDLSVKLINVLKKYLPDAIEQDSDGDDGIKSDYWHPAG